MLLPMCIHLFLKFLFKYQVVYEQPLLATALFLKQSLILIVARGAQSRGAAAVLALIAPAGRAMQNFPRCRRTCKPSAAQASQEYANWRSHTNLCAGEARDRKVPRQASVSQTVFFRPYPVPANWLCHHVRSCVYICVVHARTSPTPHHPTRYAAPCRGGHRDHCRSVLGLHEPRASLSHSAVHMRVEFLSLLISPLSLPLTTTSHHLSNVMLG